MAAEIFATTEHLLLRRMTNDDAAALATYRSDPEQARYQSWEVPYPADSVGFTLAAHAQGRGFATEALRAVMSLLFTEHGVHRISAECDTRNDRSVALLERVGLRRGAHHREAVWRRGEWCDEYGYAVLAEEWRDGNDGL